MASPTSRTHDRTLGPAWGEELAASLVVQSEGEQLFLRIARDPKGSDLLPTPSERAAGEAQRAAAEARRAETRGSLRRAAEARADERSRQLAALSAELERLKRR